MNEDKTILSIMSMLATGVCFGMWTQNVYVGYFIALVTFYTFIFKYDKD